VTIKMRHALYAANPDTFFGGWRLMNVNQEA
jgi:hypothetical protein